jgi:hypothetical protein
MKKSGLFSTTVLCFDAVWGKAFVKPIFPAVLAIIMPADLLRAPFFLQIGCGGGWSMARAQIPPINHGD